MGVGGGRSSSKPGSGTGGAASIEVQATGARDGRIMKQRGNGEGIDLARKGSRGGGVGLGVDAGAGRDSSSESLLSGSVAAPLVDVQGVKIGPDGGPEVGGEAGDVGGGSVLTGGPGADPARGDAERGDAPIVISERRANKAPKGEANVGVGGEEASGLRTGRHGAAGGRSPTISSVTGTDDGMEAQVEAFRHVLGGRWVKDTLGKIRVQHAPQVKLKSEEDQLASEIGALSATRLNLSSQQDKVAKLTAQFSTIQTGITATVSEIGMLETEESGSRITVTNTEGSSSCSH